MPPTVRPAHPPLATTALDRRHTRWFLVAFYALAVGVGVSSARSAEPSAFDLVAPFVFAVVMTWWCVTDARRRGQPIPLLARPWFLLAAGILGPGYVIYSRGWRGVGWVALNAAVWFLVACGVTCGVWLAVHGEAGWRALLAAGR